MILFFTFTDLKEQGTNESLHTANIYKPQNTQRTTYTMRGHCYLYGLTSKPKNSKTPFFSRFSKFLLMGHWNWSKNAPVFFFLKNLNKYGR